jgi:uncharacterized OsmC-like protein
MTTSDIAVALQRAEAVFQRRPDMGLHEDVAATARWQGGTRVLISRDGGAQLATDLPVELGGTGDGLTPGWLFRAGLAACANASIVLTAATEGVELTSLEVRTRSRSDTRGLLGMAEPSGASVCSIPRDVQLHVRIAARDVSPQRLRALVTEGCRRAPIPNAVQGAVPIELRIEAVEA